MSYERVAGEIVEKVFGKPNLGMAATLKEQVDLQNAIIKALQDERDTCAKLCRIHGADRAAGEITSRS
ncbi:hypothetical protein W911_08840 [Hyphomicrobium nitrativorans NL23]|uniref:Uncharacterized protein n=1 Tax=Hyphomicrobium nitrativorans NL23 TaxID=1029756 RepID=V5SHW1_9HYPH|nr:hypothetical protein [Hyphomicrobium nitrativorans]AHB50128.1 hypothetical protein W911_08840 [Hyphomicrobium nitrativorans NL23]